MFSARPYPWEWRHNKAPQFKKSSFLDYGAALLPPGREHTVSTLWMGVTVPDEARSSDDAVNVHLLRPREDDGSSEFRSSRGGHPRRIFYVERAQRA